MAKDLIGGWADGGRETKTSHRQLTYHWWIPHWSLIEILKRTIIYGQCEGEGLRAELPTLTPVTLWF